MAVMGLVLPFWRNALLSSLQIELPCLCLIMPKDINVVIQRLSPIRRATLPRLPPIPFGMHNMHRTAQPGTHQLDASVAFRGMLMHMEFAFDLRLDEPDQHLNKRALVAFQHRHPIALSPEEDARHDELHLIFEEKVIDALTLAVVRDTVAGHVHGVRDAEREISR